MISKSEFTIPAGTTYLDTAAEGIPPLAAADAVQCYLRDKGRGSSGRKAMFEEERLAKESVAHLLGTTPESVALLSSASEGLNLLGNSIAWRAGDEVVTTDLEFPSGVLAFLRLREKGVHLRVVSSQDGTLTGEQICEAIGPAARLVVLSQVSFKTGTNLDCIPMVSAEAHRRGALLCVDATQALGRLPVSVEGVDVLVASSYKWLLGIHGLGITYVSPAMYELLQKACLGWYSVADLFRPDRFQAFEPKAGAARIMPGMPNFAAIYALRRSTELLSRIGVEKIHATLAPLVTQLRQGFQNLGVAVLTPADYPSGIVSFAHRDYARIGAELAARDVVVWAGDGRVRASIHLYNDANDVAAIHSALEAVLAGEVA